MCIRDSANAIAGREALGLPMETMDTIQADYATLSKEEVDAAIAKHMQVDKAVTVVAGSIWELVRDNIFFESSTD